MQGAQPRVGICTGNPLKPLKEKFKVLLWGPRRAIASEDGILGKDTIPSTRCLSYSFSSTAFLINLKRKKVIL